MNRFFLTLALTASLTAPAFAEGMAQEMTCLDFMAMGQDDMMAATTAAMEADAMAADGMMSAEDQMAAMVKACTEHPDMMAMDAMHMMQ